MAASLVIHISVGNEKRTEFFSEERIRIGASENDDIQIHSKSIVAEGTWLELEITENIYIQRKVHQDIFTLVSSSCPSPRC